MCVFFVAFFYARVCVSFECSHDIRPSFATFFLSGDFFIPAFQCPHQVERIGTLGDGGKWVCGMDRVVKQDKCVIYSFGTPLRHFFFVALLCIAHVMIDVIGINGESSFEQSLLKRAPSCEVWGYDFSVNGVRVFFFHLCSFVL